MSEMFKRRMSRSLLTLAGVAAIAARVVPAQAGGFLWISSEFVSDPAPIHRYNIATGTIDLVTVPGIAGDVVNNLATDGTVLYLGTDDGQDFWKANEITGVPFFMGNYNPPTNPASMEDGAFRALNGHLYRANYTSAAERMYETDTNGTVLAAFQVNNVDFLCGLEFVGLQLYGTSLDGGSFGAINFNGLSWDYVQIPLAAIPGGHLYGGLAYDQQAGVLYLATTDLNNAYLWTVNPGAGTATQVKNLTTESGYPSGFILPDAMGWVQQSSCGNAFVEPPEECDPPGSIMCPAGSPMGAFLPCNQDCTCPTTPTTTSTTITVTTTTSTTTTTLACVPQGPMECDPNIPGDCFTRCANGVDDDCDQLIDCADPDCGPSRCERPPRGQCDTDADCPGPAPNPCICPDIRKDPSTIRLGAPGAGLDVFSSHGRVEPSASIDVMNADVTWLVTNDDTGAVVYEGTLHPGDLTPNAKGTLFRYLDRGAPAGHGQRSGIYKARVHVTRGGTSYGYKLQAYGDMALASGPKMSIQFYIGDPARSFIHSERWTGYPWGWKATGFD